MNRLFNEIKFLLGRTINSECKYEMFEHRKSLLSDYKLSPGVVVHCSNEINKYCSGGIERGGKTIHCLFRNAKQSMANKDGNFNKRCIYQVYNWWLKFDIRQTLKYFNRLVKTLDKSR
jgi:hypothetical protein